MKASLNRAYQSVELDAKPGDLPMDRLKSYENKMEDRTSKR